MHDLEFQMEMLTRCFAGSLTLKDRLDISKRFSVVAVDTLQPYLRLPRQNSLKLIAAMCNALVSDNIKSGDELGNFHNAYLMITTHPDLVLPLGYDEVRYASATDQYDQVDSLSVVGGIADGIDEGFADEFSSAWRRARFNTQYRLPGGKWQDFQDVASRILRSGTEQPLCVNELADFSLGFEERWFRKIQKNGGPLGKTLLYPAVAQPNEYDGSDLQKASRAILAELAKGRVALADLHWRTLEELVAELLSDMGLVVSLTPRANDGGRDVIARGELIPGEPMVLAVEVKQRRTVPISEVRNAMWANRDFPALVVATSGKFSAGVYRERLQGEAIMRLYLKDGDGLSQWIEHYVKRNFAESEGAG